MGSPDATRALVRGYYDAWTSGDLDGARSRLADDLDFEGSIDRFTSAEAFVSALGGFAGMLEEAHMLREFYDASGAALLYDCVTRSPAGTIRTAEFFQVEDGKIRQIRLVFDATKLRELMTA
jgi:SnoaL-like domain